MDIDEIRVEIFKRTGINIGIDDPFFAALLMLSGTAKEIDRKNDATLDEMHRLREEIERQTKKLIASPTPENRHPVQNTFPIIVVAVASFVAGFGSHDLPAVGSIAVGMIVGFLASQVSFLFQKNDDDRRKLENPPSKAAAAFVWTETDFQRAASQTKLSKRTLRACRDVLIESGTIGTASVRHGVLPLQIHRGLSVLRQAESSARR